VGLGRCGSYTILKPDLAAAKSSIPRGKEATYSTVRVKPGEQSMRRERAKYWEYLHVTISEDVGSGVEWEPGG